MKVNQLLKEGEPIDFVRAVWRRVRKIVRIGRPLQAEYETSPINAHLELPTERQVCKWYVHVCGWAYSRVGPIQDVEATLDGINLGNVKYGLLRTDVVQVHPEAQSEFCGYGEHFVPPADIKDLSVDHELVVKITDAMGNMRILVRQIRLQSVMEAAIKLTKLKLPTIDSDGELQPLSGSSVSVIIPTLNAGEEFAALLSSLRSQRGIEKIEIIVVDSGSSDQTVVLAREYAAQVLEIPPQDFSHSFARNHGARAAKGNYLLFMTQDALPGSSTWLAEMLLALRENRAIAASCAETPRTDTDLFYQTISWSHYRFLEIEHGDRVMTWPQSTDYDSLRKNCQLCNVACLIDRKIFADYEFRYDYAEDLDLGMRLVQDGKRLLLLSSTPVIHSHHRPPYYYLRRGYVDTIWLSKLFADYPLPAALSLPDLSWGIVYSFHLLQTFTDRLAADLQLPYPAEKFIFTARSSLEALVSNQPQLGIEKEAIFCTEDDKYRQFLNLLATAYPASPSQSDATALFLDSLLSSMQPFWQYILQTYELIDDTLVEGIKQSVFKSHALTGGAFMASHSLRYPEAEDPLASQIQNELRRGI